MPEMDYYVHDPVEPGDVFLSSPEEALHCAAEVVKEYIDHGDAGSPSSEVSEVAVYARTHKVDSELAVVETPAGKLVRLGQAVIAAARELKTKEAGDEWMAAYRTLLEAVEAFDA